MKKSKPKLVLTILIFSIILFISAQNALSVDNTLDMELSYRVSCVNSLLEFNDKLYAGTIGYTPGCGEIYVYDGTEWNLDFVVPNTVQIWSLCEYNNKLYAGTGNSDGKIYVYDPVENFWDLAYDTQDSIVMGLCVYDGILYAATSYSGYIYAFNGNEWALIHQIRPQHWVGCFVEYDGRLYVGTGSNYYKGAIYVFDGDNWAESWSSTSIWDIKSLIVYDGKMYAAGWGFDATNNRQGVILIYDVSDGSWNIVFESEQDCFSLTVYGDKLYTTGWSPSTSNFAVIYSFDGNSWEMAFDFTSYYEKAVWSMGSYNNKFYAGSLSGIYVSKETIISAVIDLEPDTLNLKCKGKWVTLYLELPNGYNLVDIDISTLLLQQTIPAELTPTEIGDYDFDGIPDLMVKFDREALQSIVLVSEAAEITVSGFLIDGTKFLGTAIIRVIDEGNEHVNEDPSSIE